MTISFPFVEAFPKKSVPTILMTCLASLGLLGPATSYARDEGGWTFFLVGNMCLLQNPKYESTNMGHFFSNSSKVPEKDFWHQFENTPLAKCFHEKQWISSSLCDDAFGVVFAKEEIPAERIESLRKKHMAELDQLQKVSDFYGRAITGGKGINADVACPDLPKPQLAP